MTATFTVDSWDPGYGTALSSEALSDSSAQLDLDVETPAAAWEPISAPDDVQPPQVVLFCDGVRRIDARAWIHGAASQPAPAIAASYAAGVVRCDGRAQLVDSVVARGIFTAAADAPDVNTGMAIYPVRAATGSTPEELSLALQQRLAECEAEIVTRYRTSNPVEDDLVVIDGPLRGSAHLDRAIGYIKTHQSAYLDHAHAKVVGALKPGQRTPVFTIGTSWIRRSWYIRLPGASEVPWSGVVRIECSADLSADQAIALANITSAALPKFASSPHKDPRAPQNLIPIGGLEAQLRHRLGDQRVLYRALRIAAARNTT